MARTGSMPPNKALVMSARRALKFTALFYRAKSLTAAAVAAAVVAEDGGLSVALRLKGGPRAIGVADSCLHLIVFDAISSAHLFRPWVAEGHRSGVDNWRMCGNRCVKRA